ncbi:biotin-dependent carboxyltransferase family protein [uncultured Pseudoteredinibacter sp.]|uniref:5-oxoprolinase subunit C family protein n=1 Tax=uncultured Pseudoteredinibacter sp. TaxID=1641701 RepID=UPI002625DDA5|nr:biotin-dependent carboxyltransferase family protein [uncultured Pseudoteredinibacter sp.]
MQGLTVIAPGILSLLQDAGRFGQQQIGLTTGGPLDSFAFTVANRLCHNSDNACAIEVSIGGLTLESSIDSVIALTGAKLGLKINGQNKVQWQSHAIKAGDKINIGFASEKNSGCRAYLAVAGGFDIAKQFGSQATVSREGIGGLQGGPLQKADLLPSSNHRDLELLSLSEEQQSNFNSSFNSNYPDLVELRVILGYQQNHFSPVKQAIFFSSEYTVSDLCDRMGYRLEGPKVNADIEGILSEGICLGAIQVPADGQPIVLMNDRQTIGGYPKIGAVFGPDLAKLAQLSAGGRIKFSAMDINDAHQELLLAKRQLDQLVLEAL